VKVLLSPGDVLTALFAGAAMATGGFAASRPYEFAGAALRDSALRGGGSGWPTTG